MSPADSAARAGAMPEASGDSSSGTLAIPIPPFMILQRIFLILLATIALMQPTTGTALTLDFDSVTDLNADFTGIPWAANSTLADGVGLNGSRGMKYENSLVGAASDLRIYTPVTLSPTTPSWELSIAFNGTNLHSFGYPMIGILGRDSRYQSDVRYPNGFATPDSSTPTIYTTISHGTLSLYASNGSYRNSVAAPGVFDSTWHILALQVTYLDTTSSVINAYDVRVSLFESDQFGIPGELLARIDDSFSTVQFQGVNDLYGFFGVDTPNYFGWAGPGYSGAIDNFAITIPEPGSGLLCLLGVIVILLRRVILNAKLANQSVQ